MDLFLALMIMFMTVCLVFMVVVIDLRLLVIAVHADSARYTLLCVGWGYRLSRIRCVQVKYIFAWNEI